MSMILAGEFLRNTTSPDLKSYRDNILDRGSCEYVINIEHLTTGALVDIVATAKELKETKTAKAAEALLATLSGKFDVPVLPSFCAPSNTSAA